MTFFGGVLSFGCCGCVPMIPLALMSPLGILSPFCGLVGPSSGGGGGGGGGAEFGGDAAFGDV
jgi:hypothetical protein